MGHRSRPEIRQEISDTDREMLHALGDAGKSPNSEGESR